MKTLQSLFDETRTQLKQSLTIATSVASIYGVILQAKHLELLQLSESVKSLKN